MRDVVPPSGNGAVAFVCRLKNVIPTVMNGLTGAHCSSSTLGPVWRTARADYAFRVVFRQAKGDAFSAKVRPT